MKVLVVEDDQLNQKVFQVLLTAVGSDVEIVDNGEAAIKLVKSEVYDIILMDVGLPGKDGCETTREIRKLTKRQVPIIGISAHAFASDKQKCLEAGMNEVMIKPIMKDQLEKILTQWLPTNNTV